ncbi:MAG: hypothetical protein M3413_03625 [Bacteroidota bacterium]|jgi:hypothetical protein|nr:hypothetical protein [Flavisolibacter sp.]MDQ3550592.1 hypothetical protein [Bacteroidota bacterium]
MVQTDISQLSAETAEWRQILRTYRDELQESKKLLQNTCGPHLTKQQLTDVEHFQNQFHIQLINIHDVKQHIKSHERRIEMKEQLSEQSFAEHEMILDEFLTLQNTLQELRNEFKNYISAISC